MSNGNVAINWGGKKRGAVCFGEWKGTEVSLEGFIESVVLQGRKVMYMFPDDPEVQP